MTAYIIALSIGVTVGWIIYQTILAVCEDERRRSRDNIISTGDDTKDDD